LPPGELADHDISLPFSDAVRIGNSLYLSGNIGCVPGTREIPSDPADEARNVLDAIQAVLKEAGMTIDDLVFVQVFTIDIGLFDTFTTRRNSGDGQC
jgi:2-iminobutanoate/2-iminopropanoate deaminase